MANVLISYRRSDSTSGYASWLYDRLANELGPERIFMDVDSLPIGVDFAGEVQKAVARTDVALILIGPLWLSARDESGNRRLDDPDDFVRLEVAAALSSGVIVIPVLVDRADMPRSDELPPDIRGLARRQALVLERSANAGINELLTVIRRASPDDEVTHGKARQDAENNSESARPEDVDHTPPSRPTPESPAERPVSPQKLGESPANVIQRQASTERSSRDEAPVDRSAGEDQSSRESGIFICYRREDSRWPARSLADALRSRFGQHRVFMDVDSVGLGKWQRQIDKALAASRIVIVLIGPEWLNEMRRRADRSDQVRYELAEAIRLDKLIVPATLGHTELPSRDELPDEIAPVADEEAYPLLEDKAWFPTLEILIKDIAIELGVA